MLVLQKPEALPTQVVFGPRPTPPTYDKAEKAIKDADRASFTASWVSMDQKLGQAWKLWAKDSEKELMQVTGKEGEAKPSRGGWPKLVWKDMLNEEAKASFPEGNKRSRALRWAADKGGELLRAATQCQEDYEKHNKGGEELVAGVVFSSVDAGTTGGREKGTIRMDLLRKLRYIAAAILKARPKCVVEESEAKEAWGIARKTAAKVQAFVDKTCVTKEKREEMARGQDPNAAKEKKKKAQAKDDKLATPEGEEAVELRGTSLRGGLPSGVGSKKASGSNCDDNASEARNNAACLPTVMAFGTQDSRNERQESPPDIDGQGGLVDDRTLYPIHAGQRDNRPSVVTACPIYAGSDVHSRGPSDADKADARISRDEAKEELKEAWKEVRGEGKEVKGKGKCRRRKTAKPVQVSLPDLPPERPTSARMEALRLRIRAKQE